MEVSQGIYHLKNSILNWTISIFIILLTIAAIYSSLFRTPQKENTALSNYINLFSQEKIKSLNSIKITNNQGAFLLEKDTATKRWFITSPRHIVAQKDIVNNLIDAISNIRVKNIFPKDSINLTNFALNTPRYTVNVTYTKDSEQKEEILDVGLKNPINHTDYVKLEHKDIIYQISAIEYPIESIGFTHLINTKVFPFKPNEITAIQLVRYNRTFVNLQLKDGHWISNGNTTQQDRAHKFLQKLLKMDSHIILDKLTEKQQKRIDRYYKNVPITLTFTVNGNPVKYNITTLIKNFPDIDLDGELIFFVKSENSDNYLLIKQKEYGPLLRSIR